MTTGQWLIVDHVVALLSVAAWFGAGVTVAFRRARLALGLLAAAVLVSLARVATVAMLAGRGWWFVQEKVLLGLPMLAAARRTSLPTGRSSSTSSVPTRWGPTGIKPARLRTTACAGGCTEPSW